MAIYVPWLSDAARLTGYPVVELAGWRERGHGGMTSVEGVVCHHTAGPKTGEYPSLAVVRDGRAGLAGPLANFGLGRSGTVYVNAAGTAWHAGTSAWAGMTDLNSRFLGIEAEDDGDGVWTAEQLDAYPRLCAALCHYMRRDASRVCAHRECATPAGRKPDPTGIDMGAFRARVGQLLANPLQLIPRGAPLEDDMPTAREIADAILDTPITRQGDLLPPGPKSTTTLRNEVAYTTNESYRVANLAGQVAELARLVHAGGVDPAVVQAAVTAALGGGLDITGTAVPKKG